jgi:hypothetical protein
MFVDELSNFKQAHGGYSRWCRVEARGSEVPIDFDKFSKVCWGVDRLKVCIILAKVDVHVRLTCDMVNFYRAVLHVERCNVPDLVCDCMCQLFSLQIVSHQKQPVSMTLMSFKSGYKCTEDATQDDLEPFDRKLLHAIREKFPRTTFIPQVSRYELVYELINKSKHLQNPLNWCVEAKDKSLEPVLVEEVGYDDDNAVNVRAVIAVLFVAC